MKTFNHFALMLLGILICSNAVAQQYEVTYSTAPYQGLVNANVVDEENPNLEIGYPLFLDIPIGFDFVFLGETYNSFGMTENGYAFFSIGGTTVSFISFYDADLKNFQDDAMLSPIYYLTEGEEGNRIFKCEMVQVGFEEDQENNDYANVQLWFYENCNDFEIRVGPVSIDPLEDDLFYFGNTSPFFAYGLYDPESYYILAGDPTAPYQQTSNLVTLDEVPQDGTIYTFSNCDLSLEEKPSTGVNCFPNPAGNVLNVSLAGSSEVRIHALDGTLLSSTQSIQHFVSLDLSNLSSGMYMLQVVSVQGIHSKRFFKL